MQAYLGILTSGPALSEEMAKVLAEALSQIPGVKKADPTHGPYDAIAVVDVASGELLSIQNAIIVVAKKVTGRDADVVICVVRDLGVTLARGIIRVKNLLVRDPDPNPAALARIPGVTAIHVVTEGMDDYVCDVVAPDKKEFSRICSQIRDIGGMVPTLEVFA